MFEVLKAKILFDKLLGRPDISKAYAMVPQTDSWYDTIRKVHDSLALIQTKPHRLLEITSADGLKLKAQFYPNGSETTVICCHGYTSHAEREWAFPGLFYLSLGYNVLIPYQRAHGLSQGKYITFGALEHQDMVRWVREINTLHPQGSIFFHGLSMGGGIVLDLAGVEMENVKCLIADAPNTSILDFFRGVSKSVFKADGEKVAEAALKRFRKTFGCDAGDFESLDIVSRSRYPIFLSAGSNENLEETLEALKQANPLETRVLILPGCNHGNGMYKQTQLYQSEIRTFLEAHL